MPNRVLQKVSELPVAVPWSSVIQTALWLPVGLPWSPQLPCQTNVWPRKQSAPFSEFGRSISGQGRFRAAMPVWRLTDNTDSISGQRRRRKYQRPTEGERRAIIDAHLADDDRKRDLKKTRDGIVNLRPLSIHLHRWGRLQAARQRSAPSVGRREQGPAGDVSGGQSPVDAETSGPHLAAVRVPAARTAMSLR